jgi:hypothetical protein
MYYRGITPEARAGFERAEAARAEFLKGMWASIFARPEPKPVLRGATAAA